MGSQVRQCLHGRFGKPVEFRTSGSPPRMPAPALFERGGYKALGLGKGRASPPSSLSKPGWKSSTTKPGCLPPLLSSPPAPMGPAPGKTRHPRRGRP